MTTETIARNPLRLKERLEGLCCEMIDRGILFSEAVEQFEKCFITEIVRRSGGNASRAAGTLGIHRNTLAKRLTQLRSRPR